MVPLVERSRERLRESGRAARLDRREDHVRGLTVLTVQPAAPGTDLLGRGGLELHAARSLGRGAGQADGQSLGGAGSAVVGVEQDQRPDPVPAQRAQDRTHTPGILELGRVVRRDGIPAELHPGAPETAAGEQPGRGVRFGGLYVEVDADRVAQPGRWRGVQVGSPRLQPVRSCTEGHCGLLPWVDRLLEHARAADRAVAPGKQPREGDRRDHGAEDRGCGAQAASCPSSCHGVTLVRVMPTQGKPLTMGGDPMVLSDSTRGAG